MARNPKGAKVRQRTIPAWTYERALEVLPYLDRLMQSLRENWIEARSQHRRAQTLAQRQGRPNRQALIAHQEAQRATQRAGDLFEETFRELQELGIFCSDPIRGEALLPFIHADQPAWFIYDLFDSDRLRYWRYHHEAAETRRPVVEAVEVV
jgi:hypothetical protein